ncbi:phosphatase PAP2 family protein [Streptomyces sp. NPDC006529]|uniref:phosphatase PAP2 family protein n=1 Tax=Streptomyces sp. NPDC006529 TaxID=3157177 RepID=UPI0033AA4038
MSRAGGATDDAPYTAAGGRRARGAARVRRFDGASPAAFLLACAVLHLLAVWTPLGQAAENALVRGYADNARILAVEPWGPPPLTGPWATLIAGSALIAVVAGVRRRWREGCAALATVIGTLGTTEFLSTFVLVRPGLVGAAQPLIAPSFPSGHVAIAAALALAGALVSPARARPWVVAVGAAWTAVIAGGVQALYWHRPSDVLGATLLACASHGFAVRLLGPDRGRDAPRPRAAVPLALAALGALWASSRDDAWSRPLVFAAAAFACAVLVRLSAFGAAATPRASGPGPR